MDEPLLTATRYLQAAGVRPRLGPDVVLAFDLSAVRVGSGRRAFNRLRRRSGDRSAANHPFRAVTGLGEGIDLVVTSPGRPAAAATLELLAALGARRVVSVGTAAALVTLETGSGAIVGRAGTDGARLRYPSGMDRPTPALQSLLTDTLGLPEVVTCTTDVPFRQTPAALETARRDAQVLEMECSALFQVGAALGLAVASVVVVSDHYDPGGWRPGEPELVGSRLAVFVERIAEGLALHR